MGATTIVSGRCGTSLTSQWKRWDSMLPDGSINPGGLQLMTAAELLGNMTSLNHYALGSVAHFLHATVGGLSIGQPGWKEATIRPPSGGTVTSASTSYSSMSGTFAVSWSLEDRQLNVQVDVPPNTTARVILESGETVAAADTTSSQRYTRGMTSGHRRVSRDPSPEKCQTKYVP